MDFDGLVGRKQGRRACQEVEQRLRSAVCYGGLDLGSVNDLAAWVMVFPGGGEELSVIARFWCPEERLYDTTNRYRAQYQAWAREGWLQTTSGRAIEYSFIKAQILRDAESYPTGGSQHRPPIPSSPTGR